MGTQKADTVAVAVSGGCDSLYALVALHEAAQQHGGTVFALHARFLPTQPIADAPDPVTGLQQICTQLGIALHVQDCTESFEKHVVQPFIESYASSQTPNPCVQCNTHLKFGVLWEAAQALGADALATGHYAGLREHPQYGRVLQRGLDKGKDQTYFLGMVPRERLKHALFPLAGVQKQDVRSFLEQRGLPIPVPRESQEICFVPHDDYRAFLRNRGIAAQSGAIRLTDGTRLGTHDGLWHYTEGQRRGLGLAWRAPLYVLKKDVAQNTLIVGEREECFCTSCRTARPNFLVAPELWPQELYVQLRFRQKAVPATIDCHPDALELRFAPQDPPAAGQFAAVYDAEGCLLAAARIVPPC